MARDLATTDEMAKMRSELFATRMALVNMAPVEFGEFLIDFFNCNSNPEAYEWHERAAQKILSRVKAKPAAEMGDFHSNSDRAYCPLCGGSSDNVFGTKGFAYPEGLHRHLTGSYNARHCAVMKAALELARESARERALTVASSDSPRKLGAPWPKR